MTLDKLADKYGTDKGKSCGMGHNYAQLYDIILHSYVNITEMIEIGIQNGASLKMWYDFFPNCKIHGLDILDKSVFNSDRVVTHVIDQSKKDQLISLVKGKITPELIIDDGSHSQVHQIISFFTLFQFLKSGGLYIIEDVNHDGFDCLSNRRFDRHNIDACLSSTILSNTTPEERTGVIGSIKSVFKCLTIFKARKIKRRFEPDHLFFVFFKE